MIRLAFTQNPVRKAHLLLVYEKFTHEVGHH